MNFGLSLILIFLAAIIGALPPLLGKWSSRQLHLFMAFGAGVFLGAVFFHMMPEILVADAGFSTYFMFLNGFMLVLFVERVLVRHRHLDCEEQVAHRHQVVGISALIGLVLHSLTAGVALAAGSSEPRMAAIILLAIISHKSVASFSLSTVFSLSGIPRRKIYLYLLGFACSTPLGALLALPLLELIHAAPGGISLPTAMAAGTFLYVATMDLLPESFHDTRRRIGPFLALSLGIAVMIALRLADG